MNLQYEAGVFPPNSKRVNRIYFSDYDSYIKAIQKILEERERAWVDKRMKELADKFRGFML